MQREIDGRNGRYALGRKLLRFAISVLRMPHVYAPPEVRCEPPDSPFWRIHLRLLEKEMREKWRRYSVCPDPERDLLRQWEQMVKEVYHVGIHI